MAAIAAALAALYMNAAAAVCPNNIDDTEMHFLARMNAHPRHNFFSHSTKVVSRGNKQI